VRPLWIDKEEPQQHEEQKHGAFLHYSSMQQDGFRMQQNVLNNHTGHTWLDSMLLSNAG